MQLKESEIIHAERLLAKAHQTMDLDVIESLLHNDYIVVQPGGELESKEDILRSFKSGKRYWDKAEVNELEVKIYGPIARVIGIWSASGMNNEEHFNYQARFISIWLREDNKWQNISYSSSEIKD